MANLEMQSKNLGSQIMQLSGPYEKQAQLVEQARINMDNYKETVDLDTRAIIDYNDLLKVSTSDSCEEINKAIENSTNTSNSSLSERLNYAIQYYDSYLREQQKKNGKITEEDKITANSMLDTLTNLLIEQSNTVENLSPEIIKSWATLGEQNKDKFLEKFEKLPHDIKQNIIDKMYENGYNISSELQRGINSMDPTIKINADTSGAQYTIESFLNKMKTNKMYSAIGGILGAGFKAQGGIYSKGSWKDIPQYANGGAPNHGSLVFAGENGPEILGNANGKTEILNKSQIASALYSAVYSAMSQFNGGGVAEINVHADKGTIVETSVNGIQQYIDQTGTLPFTIPLN